MNIKELRLRPLLFWTILIALLFCRVPYLSAEMHRSVDSAGVIHYNPFREMIMTAAAREGVDPALVEAIIAVESAFNPRAISPKGAMGLMQLMPQTAFRYGVSNAFDPQANLTGGIRYLRDLLHLFGGDLPQALAAYNAGETAVLMYGGIPPYRETREYVRMVLARYRVGHVLPSSSSAFSVGQRASEAAQVRENAREDSPFPGVSLEEAGSASDGLNFAGATRLMRVAADRPLTKMARAPLVQTRGARTILVKSRDYHRVRSREFPTYSNLPSPSSLRSED